MKVTFLMIFFKVWEVCLTCSGPLIQRKTCAEGCSSSLPNSEQTWPTHGQTPYVGILFQKLEPGAENSVRFSKLISHFHFLNTNIFYSRVCLFIRLHSVRFLRVHFVPRHATMLAVDFLTLVRWLH